MLHEPSASCIHIRTTHLSYRLSAHKLLTSMTIPPEDMGDEFYPLPIGVGIKLFQFSRLGSIHVNLNQNLNRLGSIHVNLNQNPQSCGLRCESCSWSLCIKRIPKMQFLSGLIHKSYMQAYIWLRKNTHVG